MLSLDMWCRGKVRKFRVFHEADYRMERFVVEGRDDAEVVTATAQSPTKSRELLLADGNDDTRGCNELVRGDVIADQTI
jgi:hypothetical protein